MADNNGKRRNVRGRNAAPKYRKTSTSADSPAINLSGKTGIIIVAVLVVAAIAATFGLYKMLTGPKMDAEAYRDKLVSVNQGDLPAPPFIGWKQEYLEEPPEPLKPNDSIKEVNNEECTPGGERQAEVSGLIMNEATEWSGTEMYNTAYNAQIRVDASNANVESNGLDYEKVDSYLRDCSYVEFVQNGEDDSRRVRITRKPLEVKPDAWKMKDGRAWSETIAVSTPEGFKGTSTTVSMLGHGRGATLQGQLTFEGRLDDNAVNTMDLLWTAQTAKALEED